MITTSELNIKTDEIPVTPTGNEELAMETQAEIEKPKYNYNKVHVSLIVLLICQVLFLLTFSEAMSFIWGGEPLIDIYNDNLF